MNQPGGILLCGLNGSGKTTLGKAVAELLGVPHLDAEAYYFPDPAQEYAVFRTKEEVCARLQADLERLDAFVFSAVGGNWGEEIESHFALVAVLSVPKELRLERVKQRSFARFGERMLPGGDLYEREQDFFNMVASRTDARVEDWVRCCNCPVIRLDGAASCEENAAHILDAYARL